MALIKRFVKEEDALATIEIVLIIVVLIGLVIIFKKQVVNLVNSILSSITTKSKSIL